MGDIKYPCFDCVVDKVVYHCVWDIEHKYDECTYIQAIKKCVGRSIDVSIWESCLSGKRSIFYRKYINDEIELEIIDDE